jgi:hypothetical protein
METIFDYNPTDTELKRWVNAKDPAEREKQRQFLKEILESADAPDYYYLGLLFASRGDKKRANEYFAKAKPWQRDLLIQDFP